jgi:demethylmenaquinone methyltransferase/2-methoxy-6-polyprenyl-1,4-benzoquinol methylase
MEAERPRVKPHQTLSDYYEKDSDKDAFLSELFNASAIHYDRILRYGFFGMGGNYRFRTLKRAGLLPGMRVLDVACGTAGVMREASRITPFSHIVGLDPSEGMLAVARSKFPEATFWHNRAESIPSGNEQFDFLVMGYALRHVRTFDEAFQEYFRVLKPGGKLLIMEISRPQSRIGYLLAKGYLKHFVPTLAFIICRDRGAREMMRYFCDSINACAKRETILEALEQAGFQATAWRTELGIFSAYTASKPE